MISLITAIINLTEATPIVHVLEWPHNVRDDPWWGEECLVVADETPTTRHPMANIVMWVTWGEQPAVGATWVEQRVQDCAHEDLPIGPDLAAWVDERHRLVLLKSNFGHRIKMMPSPEVVGLPPIQLYPAVALELLRQSPAPLPPAVRIHPLGRQGWTHTARITRVNQLVGTETPNT